MQSPTGSTSMRPSATRPHLRHSNGAFMGFSNPPMIHKAAARLSSVKTTQYLRSADSAAGSHTRPPLIFSPTRQAHAAPWCASARSRRSGRAIVADEVACGPSPPRLRCIPELHHMSRAMHIPHLQRLGTPADALCPRSRPCRSSVACGRGHSRAALALGGGRLLLLTSHQICNSVDCAEAAALRIQSQQLGIIRKGVSQHTAPHRTRAPRRGKRQGGGAHKADADACVACSINGRRHSTDWYLSPKKSTKHMRVNASTIYYLRDVQYDRM